MAGLHRVAGLVLAGVAMASCVSVPVDPTPGAAGKYTIGLSEIEFPNGCEWITARVRFEQAAPPPPGRTRTSEADLSTQPGSPASQVDLSQFDLAASISIVVDITYAAGQCEPYVPPKSWRFDGVVESTVNGGFWVQMSDFRLVGDRQ